MIVNASKSQVMIFDKHKGNYANQFINIDQKEIKAVSKVNVLRIKIDDKLNLNHHIFNTCKFASNQRFNKSKTSIRIQGKKGACKCLFNVKF